MECPKCTYYRYDDLSIIKNGYMTRFVEMNPQLFPPEKMEKGHYCCQKREIGEYQENPVPCEFYVKAFDDIPF